MTSRILTLYVSVIWTFTGFSSLNSCFHSLKFILCWIYLIQCRVCSGWWKCGIKTRCSFCFFRWIKDNIPFICMFLFSSFPLLSYHKDIMIHCWEFLYIFFNLQNNHFKLHVLQGTGSAGATVRIYIEQFEPDISRHDVDAQTSLKPLIGLFNAPSNNNLLRLFIYFLTLCHVADLALSLSKLEEFTGRKKPTVIT